MNLLEALREKTQDLKTKYIEQTEIWASDHYVSAMKVVGWKEVDWCKYFGLEPRMCNPGTSMEFPGMPNGFYNSKDARRMDSMKAEARSLHRMGKAEYVRRERERAERHYGDSLRKLVDRLVKKGVDEGRSDVKIISGWVGVNFEIIIEVGSVRVKAWTIIASGPVQRPHYRYLVH